MMELAEQTVLPNVDDLRSALLTEAQALADEDVEINRRMGFNGAAVIAGWVESAPSLQYWHAGYGRFWHGAGCGLCLPGTG